MRGWIVWVIVGVVGLVVLGLLAFGGIMAFTYVRIRRNLLSVRQFRSIPDLVPAVSNRAKIPLSVERLAELEPVLARDERSVRGLARVLDVSDARAAVVVSTSPLLVAAWSDEMSNAVLMQFPDEFVERYKLSVGSRLLGVVMYWWLMFRSPDYALAPDLTPGRKRPETYVNFSSLIADFLTEDKRALARAKAAITEEEWRQAAEFGKYLEQSSTLPRLGLPSYCHLPSRDANKWIWRIMKAMSEPE